MADAAHETHRAMDYLRCVRDSFHAEMRAGLATWQDGRTGAPSIRALPTYVTCMPDGHETGSFLVADLGGSNLRVGRVDLLGRPAAEGQSNSGQLYALEQHVQRVPAAITSQDDGDALFDFVADALLSFLGDESRLPAALGFTFSYPVAQSGLGRGTLLTFSKGVRCASALHRDVAEMLEAALVRRAAVSGSPAAKECAKQGVPPIRVAALLNDTVGTLLAHRYRAPACRIGVILGTGTNAALEARTVPKLGADAGPMVVNLEWGAFGDSDDLDGSRCADAALVRALPAFQIGEDAKLPLDAFSALASDCVLGQSGLRYCAADLALDAGSTNPGKQRLEKLVSGKYVGEVVRLLMALRRDAFGAALAAAQPYVLDAIDVEAAEWASDEELPAVALRLLSRLGDVNGTMGVDSDAGKDSSKFNAALSNGNGVACKDASIIPCKDEALVQFARDLRECSRAVVTRSAYLVGALLAALSQYVDAAWPGKEAVEVAVDGSLYALHRGYAERVDAALRALAPDTRLRLVLCKDDSIVGAAVAVASHQ